MIEMVVVLHLLVADTDTGKTIVSVTKTYENNFDTPKEELINLCRIDGVKYATQFTKWFKEHGHPSASTNVNCRWEPKGTTL
jgi:hypothetical protein